MADDTLPVAIDTVAKHAIRDVLRDSIEEGSLWADYPEIGEDDWYRVAERIGEITDLLGPDSESFQAAYDYLSERAGTDDD